VKKQFLRREEIKRGPGERILRRYAISGWHGKLETQQAKGKTTV